MEDRDFDLRHRAEYNNKLVIILIILTLIFGLLFVIFLTSKRFPLHFLVLFLGSLIGMIIEKRRYDEKGSYEGIDIRENRIYYHTEQDGLLIIAPQQISSINILQVVKKHRTQFQIKIYLHDSREIAFRDGSLAFYEELLRKLLHFKKENRIGGTTS